MGYKVGTDRKQLTLIPMSLDAYVPENNICRVIMAFTEQLDMKELGYKYAQCKSTGCRPYDPRMMLNLYIYGYLHLVRSSRKLQDETRRNVEVMWLMEGLTPDDKTICNFRTDNREALVKSYHVFTQMTRKAGLYGEETVAIDGTRVRANNGLKNHYNETVVKNELERAEKRINEYLDALEQADQQDAERGEADSKAIRILLDTLAARKKKYEELQQQVSAEGEVSTVDTDARMIRSGGDGRALHVGYNVQTVVDSKYHMIVDFEVTNCSNDSGNLSKMGERAKEILEVESLTCLADKGYYSGEDIALCEGNGITCLVPKPNHNGSVKPGEGRYSQKQFSYDGEADTYTCPCGHALWYRRDKKKNGTHYRVYANYRACGKCPKRKACTSTQYREVSRLHCQDTLDRVAERLRNNKALYWRRQEIIEHVFGTIKAAWGYKQFLCRGISKVSAETALSYLAYNIRRAETIFAQSKLNLAAVFG